MADKHAVPLPTLPESPISLTGLRGLRAAGVRAGIKARGRPDVGLLVGDDLLACAGIFTQNLFAAAPVRVCREHLERTHGRVAAVVVNSGNANACTGERGDEDARLMAREVATLVGCAPHEVLVASTGVIGQPLPREKVLGGIHAAHAELAREPEAGRRFLSAIMTTDAFPKEAAWLGAEHRVAGVCKGAGMIEPNMATMLAFVATDCPLSSEALRALVGPIASRSFNAVHVDSHASTNDTFLLLSTGRAADARSAATEEIRAAIEQVASRLAWLIARDGEGATKVTTILVRGAPDRATADDIARRIAKSALVRTALYGNDPNWGRFVSQVGNSPLVRDGRRVRCTLQDIVVFEAGEPVAFDRAHASRRMAEEDVRLELDLGAGTHEAVVLTSDLGYRYVEVNAEYTT
jgi:glutamate N-acetyltransferase/amino-acid N-acetyltransferase